MCKNVTRPEYRLSKRVTLKECTTMKNKIWGLSRINEFIKFASASSKNMLSVIFV